MLEVLSRTRSRLLSLRTSKGPWAGELSSSALSTATALCALELCRRAEKRGDLDPRHDLASLVHGGIDWLTGHQNEDGGWGDTVDSPSNISTTTLCWAALGLSDDASAARNRAANRAASWLTQRAGGLGPSQLARAIDAVYGKDRTFSVPILTMCALSGRFGTGRAAWRFVPALPFELAACPHPLFRWLGLPVVSYALPALIAIGQARHHHRPTRNPVTRLLRRVLREKTLRVLCSIQPDSGGFLEAAPLTGFVVMSLASIGRGDHPVAREGVRFLSTSVRADGSWPIDTNLATWVTTLSINALAGGHDLTASLSADERMSLRDGLLNQQYKHEHPYTHAAPGGWAWTDRPGGVPDADDTAGTLLALRNLMESDTSESGPRPGEPLLQAATQGVRWLLDLQNRDGGIPTFCRGWGKLPFDQSSPDLTAHALRAWSAWRDDGSEALKRGIDRAMIKAVRYLLTVQSEDGTWVPLWFGNQTARDQHNPVYGTSRVLRVGKLCLLGGDLRQRWQSAQHRAVCWLLSAQRPDGGWGGDESIPSSLEETALAVEALAHMTHEDTNAATDGAASERSLAIQNAIDRGCAWLIEHTAGGTVFEPSPIGLYFAKLWYTEQLYPIIFTLAALEQVVRRTDRTRVAPASCR